MTFNIEKICKNIHSNSTGTLKIRLKNLNVSFANTGMLISAPGKYEEDVEKEVDNVQVDIEGSEDVLLRTEGVLVFPAHHDLSVVDQIEREDEAAHSGVTNIGSSAGNTLSLICI